MVGLHLGFVCININLMCEVAECEQLVGVLLRFQGFAYLMLDNGFLSKLVFECSEHLIF